MFLKIGSALLDSRLDIAFSPVQTDEIITYKYDFEKLLSLLQCFQVFQYLAYISREAIKGVFL